MLLFIDDDDLPVADDWIAQHMQNYADSDCVGVAGRWCSDFSGDPRPRFPSLTRWAQFRYSIFKDPRTLAHGILRKEGIDFIYFTNGSIRRELFFRVGGFDKGICWNEESSFTFKYLKKKQPGEYFVFDPRPQIIRRTEIPGGLDRRTRTDWWKNELDGRVLYCHRVVAHYFPLRFFVLYPFFLARSVGTTVVWIWDPDNRHRSIANRLAATAKLLFGPTVLAEAVCHASRAEVQRKVSFTKCSPPPTPLQRLSKLLPTGDEIDYFLRRHGLA